MDVGLLVRQYPRTFQAYMMFVAIIVILLKWSEVSSVIVFLAGWVAYTPSLTETQILWSPSIIYENGFGKKKKKSVLSGIFNINSCKHIADGSNISPT